MRITYNAAKRIKTLNERGLDFKRAIEVFDGLHLTYPDTRKDYLEPRYISVGWLNARMVLLTWTPRGRARRIISMRKANERESQKYAPHLARP